MLCYIVPSLIGFVPARGAARIIIALPPRPRARRAGGILYGAGHTLRFSDGPYECNFLKFCVTLTFYW
jgi:hypothetical protein